MATYHPDRVERANDLIKMIKLDSGVEVEMIVVTDNPETYDSYKGADQVIKLPKRVGFTRASNIGEKFASYGIGWWIDDYVIPSPGWAPKALKGFWERFPDGNGVMEISGYETDCPKSISTRKYMYGINGGDWLWNDYLHCGDTETWYKTNARGQFQVYPEVLWERNKIWDDTKTESLKTIELDTQLRAIRSAQGWPDKHIDNLEQIYWEWAKGDPKNEQLVKNIFNLTYETGKPIGS
jgi:hypothetical protein